MFASRRVASRSDGPLVTVLFVVRFAGGKSEEGEGAGGGARDVN